MVLFVMPASHDDGKLDAHAQGESHSWTLCPGQGGERGPHCGVTLGSGGN